MPRRIQCNVKVKHTVESYNQAANAYTCKEHRSLSTAAIKKLKQEKVSRK